MEYIANWSYKKEVAQAERILRVVMESLLILYLSHWNDTLGIHVHVCKDADMGFLDILVQPIVNPKSLILSNV